MKGPAESTAFRCDVDICKDVSPMSCRPVARHVPRDWCTHDEELTVLAPSTRSSRTLLSEAVIFIHAVEFSTLQTTPEIPPPAVLDAPATLVNLSWNPDYVNVRVDAR